MTDDGYRADLGPLNAFAASLLDALNELDQRRRGDAEAIERLAALAGSLGELGSAPQIRARLRDEIAEIVQLLQPYGPIVRGGS
jgi:hypothetical protein